MDIRKLFNGVMCGVLFSKFRFFVAVSNESLWVQFYRQ